MNLVTYKGGCGTLYEFGQKFTPARRSVVLTDEEVKPFLNNPSYNVQEIPEEAVVPQSDEDKKRKLMKLTVEQLKEMCENSGLSVDGKKEELVDRILAPKE